jgi:hypothetical protein
LAGSADQFRFVAHPLSAPGTIAAHVAAQSAALAGAQAGVVIRVNTESDSPFYALVRQGSRIQVLFRRAAGLPAMQMADLPAAAGSYLKVTCFGISSIGLLCASLVSRTGTTYQVVAGSVVWWPVHPPLLAGLAVSAGGDGRLNAAVFNAVQLVPSPPGRH